MSIIYDALKKTQTRLKLSQDQLKTNKHLLKFYILFILFVLIGCSYVLTTLFYKPAALRTDLNKEEILAERHSTPDPWIKNPLSKSGKFVLSGIVTIENKKIALINDEMVKKGDYIEGAYVINIVDDKVYLDLGGKPLVLRIK